MSSELRSFVPKLKKLRRKRRQQWRLRQLFELFVVPEVLQPSDVGHDTYEFCTAAIDRWERFTDDPAVEAISSADCARFLRQLAASKWRGRPISRNTVRRHAVYVQRILDCAGPDRLFGRRRVAGAKALKRGKIPYLVPALIEQPPKQAYTLDELSRWIDLIRTEGPGSTRMTRPIDPGRWFASLLLLLYNTGARPGMMLRVEWGMISGQWLRVPAELMKGRRRGLEIYLNTFSREALGAMAGIHKPATTARLFPWRNYPASKSRFNALARRQLAAAGLPPLAYYGIRRLFSNQVARRSELVAAWMLGHDPPGRLKMIGRHYADPKELIPEVIERLPQPGPARQKRLF
ncbi:MAG: hypothetical protein ACYTG0_42465 [Planctomycetota bacterium]|jgi:integrase